MSLFYGFESCAYELQSRLLLYCVDHMFDGAGNVSHFAFEEATCSL